MISFKIASNASEKKRSQELVFAMYQESGYAHEDSPANDFNTYLSGDCAVTVIAARDSGEIVGTISLVIDSSFGLPMGAIFESELNRLRAKDHRLAEVCQLATIEQKNPAVLMGLYREIFSKAYEMGVTHLCFTINPKHETFYKDIGAQQLAAEKAYPAVKNAPAVPYYLHLDTMQSAGTSPLLQRLLPHRFG